MFKKIEPEKWNLELKNDLKLQKSCETENKEELTLKEKNEIEK